MNGVIVFVLLWIAALVALSVIAVQKGKVWMTVCGWLFFNPLIVIAACRIAKPTSSWARKNYQHDPLKQSMSMARFPKEAYYIDALAKSKAAEVAAESAAN